MKKFFKKISTYLLLMLFVAAIIFAINYYYGQKIAEDVKLEITEIAETNNYQLRFLEVESNPLLQKINIRDLNLTKADEFNLIINQAEVNFSWQQILNYIRSQDLELDKNLDSDIAQINYSNLNDNYQINIKEAKLKYQGNLPEEKLSEIINEENLQLLLENDHQLDFTAAELKYDFPYYRRYGLNDEEWNKLSTFNNFVLRTNYDQETRAYNVEEFNLSSEVLKMIYNFDSVINYEDESQQIVFEEISGKYDFLLTAEDLDFNANTLYQDLEFKQINFNGNFDLLNEEERLKANQLDFNLNLKEFKLVLTEILAKELNKNSFGILAENNQFEILINEFNYQQEYSYPNGSSSSELDSSMLKAEFKAEYNYSQEIPYISTAELRYKPQTAKAEQLNSFLQLALGEKITKDEAGYYQLKFWGQIDDLNFE
ncbi:hypothetical protein HSACCH_00685 [Halanaerobium saccharolyticum subsp. saccharolyticum DSM 6643]|uniref:Uncharacterized protein n=1 Tax=Halanaerobium saccharolyticum subsp. saccharolyticum DSM 6643 TaxID=1293054 RepID=M5DZ21_9FIRM|nr:hypothetical protein [Halanaerobium saccharolyticum]CCU78532.1 hypothetical protein HSACCH_00685 [Halanaerobium saccharolyticum subsp. saccharolyticum DSM 6643]